MTVCPTPEKKRYATEEGAARAGRRSQIGVGQILYPYACACGWWHCTKQAPPAPLTGTPDVVDVQRLASIPDITFRGIVVDDATGKAAVADRLALRHPSNLKRWQRMIGELMQDVQQQRREKKTDKSLAAYDWWKRSVGYEAALQAAANECRQLRAEAHVQKLQQPSEPQPALMRLGEREGPVDQKELRRIAGEAAIDRLIAAHGAEFSQYLAEECASVGAELPNRVRKYLPSDGAPPAGGEHEGVATGPPNTTAYTTQEAAA